MEISYRVQIHSHIISQHQFYTFFTEPDNLFQVEEFFFCLSGLFPGLLVCQYVMSLKYAPGVGHSVPESLHNHDGILGHFVTPR